MLRLLKVQPPVAPDSPKERVPEKPLIDFAAAKSLFVSFFPPFSWPYVSSTRSRERFAN